MVTSVPDADLGRVLMHNVMWRMSQTPGQIRFTGRPLGADTDAVLTGDLGYGAEQVARAARAGDPAVSDALLEVVRGASGYSTWAGRCSPACPSRPTIRASCTSVTRRHGDMVRADGSSAANDLLVTGTHVGTHIDALAHVSHDGLLHGGAEAGAAMQGGRFMTHGVHTIAPIVRRGVLLDVPRDARHGRLPARARDHRRGAGRRGRAAARRGRGRRCRPHPQRLGAAVRRGRRRPTWALLPACRASARKVPGGWPTSACSPPARTPWPSSGCAPGEGHALLPAHRMLLVESRDLHRGGTEPGGARHGRSARVHHHARPR